MLLRKSCIHFIFFALVLCFNAPAQTANPQQHKYVFTVAKDGTGDYKFIQDALDAMRVFPLATITLYIKDGVYNEKIELPATNTDVTFIGQSVEKTIITYNDYSGRGKLNTFNSFTAKISGNRFVAENITFANSAGPVGQAVALYVDADKAVFKNCRFLGNQDTIYAGGESSRQYFINCYIEGTTDFIFGSSTVWFERCHIHSKKNSHVTAASTPKEHQFGYVFNECILTGDSTLHLVSLGRPWRPYAAVVYIHCYIGQHIKPEGWSNWNQTDNYKTARYGEYGNFGPSSDVSARVNWSRQLSDEEIKKYTLKNIFGSWNPEKE